MNSEYAVSHPQLHPVILKTWISQWVKHEVTCIQCRNASLGHTFQYILTPSLPLCHLETADKSVKFQIMKL